MDGHFHYLPLESLQPGMRLAKPLMLVDRGVLSEALPAGHCFTTESLDRLAARHAEYACVEKTILPTSEQHQEALAREQDRLSEIFSDADLEHAPTLMLYRALLDYRANR